MKSIKRAVMLLVTIILVALSVSVPAKASDETNKTILFSTDFESMTSGEKPSVSGDTANTFTKITESTAKKSYVRVTELESNKVMHLWCEADGTPAGIRAQKSINIAELELTNMTIEAKVKSGGATAAIRFYNGSKEIVIYVGGSAESWTSVKIEITFGSEGATYSSYEYIDETWTIKEENIELALSDNSAAQIRFGVSSGFGVGTGVYYDDLKIWAMVEEQEETNETSPLMGNKQVDWEKVIPEKMPTDESSFVNNLDSHPRVFVRDWDEIKAKVSSTYETKQWYDAIKKKADEALATDTTKHVVNDRGNVLESARTGRDRIQALAFMYKVTGDKRYFDDAYQEMVDMGNWPDWSAFTSDLVTAELLQGYAAAYDWLYDDLTPEQRTTLVDIMKKQALAMYVYHYEGAIGWSFTTLTTNWNPVCNATAIMAAMAIADEEPELAEYLLEKAPPCIQNALPPYAPEGGYPEGVSYWDYGTSFLIFAVDLLENAFVDGFQLPDNYVYWKSSGIDKTCDFGIYFNGPAGRFNYGDCASGYTSCEIMYWMADRFNKPQYAWWQDNAQKQTNKYLTGYSAITSLIWYDPENAYLEPGVFPLDKFYSSDNGVNGVSMRSSWENDSALYAAMQGGDNNANHQHLSLGTYIIDYNMKRFITLHGYHDYALTGAKNEIYYKRAESYNTLIINPSSSRDQNGNAIAKLINSGTSDNTSFGILDMTQTSDDYVSARRGIMMTDNRNRVIVQDEVEARMPSEFYWFANTDAAITISSDGKSAMLEMDGERMLARIIEGPEEAKFTIMERKSLIDGVINTVPEGVKLTIHLENQISFDLAVEYIGLSKGEGIPNAWEFVPLEQWTAVDNGKTTLTNTGSATAIKVGTPNSIVNGAKTLIDTTNPEVCPIDRGTDVLVPISFISKSMDTTNSWNESNQTVTVEYQDVIIELQVGDNKLVKNGTEIAISASAELIDGVLWVPVCEVASALNKFVTKENTGLLLVSDYNASYTADVINQIESELNIRVLADSKDITFFETDRENYVLDISDGEAIPRINVVTIGSETVEVIQANNVGESATVKITINGQTNIYYIKMQRNPFESSDSFVMLSDVNVAIPDEEMALKIPDYNTFIYVEDLKDSTNWATYPKRGIVDGIINSETQNRWACNGDGWISMDFGSEHNLHSMAFAGVTQESRAYNFDIQVSTDDENWTTIYTGGAPATTDTMSIIPLGDVKARYVKIIGKGYTTTAGKSGLWNTYAEVRFYESEEQQLEDKQYWPIYFGKTLCVAGTEGQISTLIINGVDNNNNLFNLKNSAEIVHEIENSDIAEVLSDGKIAFKENGTTTLTVTVTQDGITKTATVGVVCIEKTSEPTPTPAPEVTPTPEPSATPEITPVPEPSATPEVTPVPKPSTTPEVTQSPGSEDNEGDNSENDELDIQNDEQISKAVLNDTPNTGDNNQMIFYIVMVLITVAVAIVLLDPLRKEGGKYEK